MLPRWDTGSPKHASTSGYGLSKTCSRYLLWDTGCLKNRTQIFCTKIVQRFSYVSNKNCTKFRYNFASRRDSYFAPILKKILVFAFFVVSCDFALSTYFFISSYFVKFREPILRNEWINHSEFYTIWSSRRPKIGNKQADTQTREIYISINYYEESSVRLRRTFSGTF